MFDPTQPADHSDLSSAVMRSQLTGLKALIDAILTVTGAQVDATQTLGPGESATAAVTVSGSTLGFTFGIPRGNDGAQGPPFSQAVVDGVSTLNPGDPATVSVSFDGANVRFTFGIPQGYQGSPGTDGINGGTGPEGPTGPQGPPFASAVVEGVNTLNPGDNATVSVLFDGSHVRFTFGIPRGQDGAPGPPGEVTSAQLASAMATTALNPTSVGTLAQSANPTYDPTQMQQVMDKLDELINATKRP